MSAAREEVLARVRSALSDAPAEMTVPRDYRQDGAVGPDAAALFADRVGEYDATVRRTAAVSSDVAELCQRRGAERLAIAPGLPSEWRPEGVALVDDAALSAGELDALDGVITGCALAIAETGTLVLDGSPRSGRRALTLVPDWHVCIVDESQIVETVPQAVRLLEPAVKEGRPLTFVSGPSATSDIELQRVRGVHGPRTLDVVVVSA